VDCATTGQSCVLGQCKSCGATTTSSPVRLKEVFIGTPEYLVLENTGGCPVDLSGLTLSFDTSSASGVPSTFTLPSQSLDAGATVTVVDGTAATPTAGQIGTTNNIDWQGAYGGWVMLCDGPCTTPANTVDALAFQGGTAPRPFPGVVTFSPALTAITTSNEQTDSFQRVAHTGAYPNFARSDWTTGPATTPGATTTCPLTQPVSGNSCGTYGLSCPYGTINCSCTLGLSTFLFAWSCQ
jgi:hypothetical protein